VEVLVLDRLEDGDWLRRNSERSVGRLAADVPYLRDCRFLCGGSVEAHLMLCFAKVFGVWHAFAHGQRLHDAGLGYSPEEAADAWRASHE
jgi:hypothetical protein